MWTDKDDEEINYGEWKEYDAKDALAEANKVKAAQQPDEIWPDWHDGVPAKFRIRVLGEAFSSGGNFHREAYYYIPLKLKWHFPQPLSALSKHWLPDRHSSECSGVSEFSAQMRPSTGAVERTKRAHCTSAWQAPEK